MQSTPFKVIHARTASQSKLLDLQIALACRIYRSICLGIIRIGPHTLVKINTDDRCTEAYTLDFISKNTSIPVPRVSKVVISRGRAYIFMHYINAYCLEVQWRGMTANERAQIMEQLKEYISELRRLHPPNPGKIEAIDGSGCFDERQRSDPFGPFDTVDNFHRFLGCDYILKTEAYKEYWPDMNRCKGRSYRTVFSHGDLAPRNILVKDGRIVAIVDWEFSGWYPAYWDYTRTFFNNLQFPEWWEAFQTVMEPFEDELEMERSLWTVFVRIGL